MDSLLATVLPSSLERIDQVLKLLDAISAEETADDVQSLAHEAIRAATKLWCRLNHTKVEKVAELMWLDGLEGFEGLVSCNKYVYY